MMTIDLYLDAVSQSIVLCNPVSAQVTRILRIGCSLHKGYGLHTSLFTHPGHGQHHCKTPLDNNRTIIFISASTLLSRTTGGDQIRTRIVLL